MAARHASRCFRLAVCALVIIASTLVTSEDNGAVDIQIESFVNDIGQQNPVDLILIMDRSTGIGREVFYLRIRKLCRAILQQYVPLHVDYTRLAVITFGKDVSLVFDYISAPVNTTGSKCEILSEQPSSPWRQVVYYEDWKRAAGTNLQESLQLAKEIFDKGQANRPHVSKQVVLLLTDGDYQESEDPYDQVTVLKENNKVVIYTVGCGAWQRPGQVRELASQPQYYAGCRQAWYELVTGVKLTSYAPDSQALWMDEFDGNCGVACGSHSKCQCDIWRGFTQCSCEAGYYKNGGNCEECELGAYKYLTGNMACELCPVGMTTSLTGSASKTDCTCIQANCTDPCNSDPCISENQICRGNADGNASCECAPGWSGDNCSRNDTNCDQTVDCQNGGTCVDMVSDYACVCAWGFVGRHCEFEVNECAPGDMCRNNGTCQDRRNNYYCACVAGWKGRHCQDVDKTYSTTTAKTTSTATTTTTTTNRPTTTTTTTTTAVTTSTLYSTTKPSTKLKHATTAAARVQTTAAMDANEATITQISTEDETTSAIELLTTSKVIVSTTVVGKQSLAERNRLLIIIGCSIGGAVLLVLILLLIAIFARRRHRRKQHPPPPLPIMTQEANGNISHKFSGFWKKQTVRGGTWPLEDTDTLGCPSVPSKRHQHVEDGEDVLSTAHEVSEAVLTNPRIYDTSVTSSGGMMAGWNSCLQDLVENGAILSGAIVKVDGTGRAMSGNWYHDSEELNRLVMLLHNRVSDVPAHVQDGEYHIRSNDGTTASGRTIGDLQASRVIELRRTKEYLVVAIADADVDNGDCRKEVEWIGDHINNEGY